MRARCYEPLRHPRAPGLSLTGVQLVSSSLTRPRHGASRVACAFLVYVLPPLPRCSDWASSSLISPSRFNLPRKRRRVGLHIVLFEACSAFTRLRPAHSRRHLYVTCYTEGFSHFVTSMTAPVASGWSVRRV